MNKFNLSGRTAIITGGAQGFGLAMTERFLSSGAKVIIWDIDKNVVEKSRCNGENGNKFGKH